MSKKFFEVEFRKIDWKVNSDKFFSSPYDVDRIEACNLRVAIWARQLEAIDVGNPALSFIREMQMSGHQVAALLALGLYKPAAASIRSMLETGMYYTYFRSHQIELETLARGGGYYITKSEVVEFHKQHTVKFKDIASQIGLLTELEKWYGAISSIVHGQIPGVWNKFHALKDITFDKPTLDLAIKTFCACENTLHLFLLSTVGRQFWDSFSVDAKKRLLAHLSLKIKTSLELDAA
ncbi:MAG: hypothetical protein WCL28_14220 [bacterium]